MEITYRIASDHGSRFIALDPNGHERSLILTAAIVRPIVGDVVIADDDDRIVALVARRSTLARARAGGAPQPIAANLDVVFVVTAPGRDFSPRRVERYLLAIHTGGIQPVIVLNKRDLADDLAALVAELVAVAGDAPVLTVAARDGAGCDALLAHLPPGATAALVGSSGVGKSTLANVLLGEAHFAIGDIRASDGRGRHTSTRRELVALPDNAWLIDTPGMRAFAPWADDDALNETFADIAEAAQRCRFRNCAHAGEPNCAVAEEIDPTRLTRWQTLRAELAYLDRRDDPALHAETRRRWKSLTKSQRAFNKLRTRED